MVLISYTRLHRRTFLDWPAIWCYTILSTWQVINTPGFLRAKLLIDGHGASWTVSAWEDKSVMQKYRSSGAHRIAVQRIPEWCDEAAAGHWEKEDSNLPTWEEVHRHMMAEGYQSRLSKPSPAHLERKIREPLLSGSLGMQLRPRKEYALECFKIKPSSPATLRLGLNQVGTTSGQNQNALASIGECTALLSVRAGA